MDTHQITDGKRAVKRVAADKRRASAELIARAVKAVLDARSARFEVRGEARAQELICEVLTWASGGRPPRSALRVKALCLATDAMLPGYTEPGRIAALAALETEYEAAAFESTLYYLLWWSVGGVTDDAEYDISFVLDEFAREALELGAKS